jgi:uncharacterized membrane protein YdjX (TVP38/TMEM64 family)
MNAGTAGSGDSRKKGPYKLIILGLIVIAGILLHQTGIVDWHTLLAMGERYAHTWWFPAAIVVVKAVLYMFAMPGSSMYWISGLFFRPPVATALVVVGGVGGAVLAYYFSQKMSQEMAERIRASRFFGIMRNHSDFATLSAIRTLPNFPHSIINYGSGILNVPMPRFLVSTIIGFAAKGYLYTSAIHHAATADELADVVRWETILPLVGLTLLFIIGKLLQRRFPRKTTERDAGTR